MCFEPGSSILSESVWAPLVKASVASSADERNEAENMTLRDKHPEPRDMQERCLLLLKGKGIKEFSPTKFKLPSRRDLSLYSTNLRS